jgi:hypothetical protein
MGVSLSAGSYKRSPFTNARLIVGSSEARMERISGRRNDSFDCAIIARINEPAKSFTGIGHLTGMRGRRRSGRSDSPRQSLSSRRGRELAAWVILPEISHFEKPCGRREDSTRIDTASIRDDQPQRVRLDPILVTNPEHDLFDRPPRSCHPCLSAMIVGDTHTGQIC